LSIYPLQTDAGRCQVRSHCRLYCPCDLSTTIQITIAHPCIDLEASTQLAIRHRVTRRRLVAVSKGNLPFTKSTLHRSALYCISFCTIIPLLRNLVDEQMHLQCCVILFAKKICNLREHCQAHLFKRTNSATHFFYHRSYLYQTKVSTIRNNRNNGML